MTVSLKVLAICRFYVSFGFIVICDCIFSITTDDIVFYLQMRPNEYWTSDEVEDLVNQWLQEDKLLQEIEGEPGKYKPVFY